MIKCNKLTVGEGDQTILKNIQFEIPSGKVGVLLTLDEQGKQTLLNCINENQSYIGDVNKGNENDRVSYYKKLPMVCNDLTGFEYLEMLLAMNTSIHTESVWDLVKSLGIDYELNVSIKKVSLYTNHCLILLASLILDNDIILIDEPFYGVDRESQKNIIKIINNLKEKGKTILISTNIIRFGFEIGDELLIMTKGKLKQVNNLFKSIKQYEINVMPLLMGS
ncbi:P-loop NTPase family protein [Haloplasma contractile]|uniref:AAA domain protein n=1 Tax=Haloplasma contractile SSD-17B TaxID=1033810 RepID=U2FFZ7_9MOLU|nr:ABC transporter ATP-binding protein [Haloplasma contractile]ERJ11825.1 AAA domain protein [Haloplasma contractile SSD-17B]